jgi:hypothetical protein
MVGHAIGFTSMGPSILWRCGRNVGEQLDYAIPSPTVSRNAQTPISEPTGTGARAIVLAKLTETTNLSVDGYVVDSPEF